MRRSVLQPSKGRPSAFLFLSILLSLVGFDAWASDGVFEINQACALDTGCFSGDTSGFPVTIGQAGSYRLTSSLTPGSADAISVSSSDVSVDLNGFALVGPGSLRTGIVADDQDFLTVRNGVVHSFQTGLDVGGHARIEDLTIRGCSSDGLVVNGGGGRVSNNLVVDNQTVGLHLATDTAYGGNVFANNGTDVVNGAALATNLCDGETCTSPPLRRYYLTTATYDGSEAADAGVCADGFHFAALYEIIDPSNLQYDAGLGFVKDDSGEGPPAGVTNVSASGWIRTGFSSSDVAVPGWANCNNWSSDVTTSYGSIAWLLESWDTGVSQGLAIGPASGPWVTQGAPCNAAPRVWCVQD